jgi:MFS family permease
MAARRRPLLALTHRDFRRLWLAQLVSLTGSQMQAVAIGWHIYLLTHSPLALGMVGLTRVVPIIVFSLWGGILADRRDRRWVMFWAQIVMTAVAASLSTLTFVGHERLWMIYALNAVAAAATAFDAPARQALIPRLVPMADLPGALSLNLTAFHTAMIAGPAAAGLLIAGTGRWLAPGAAPARMMAESAVAAHGTAGLAWIYALNALSFLAVLAALRAMDPSLGRAPGDPLQRVSPLSSLKEGLRFVFATPLMVWTMALDFFATFFSGAMSLLPIFADQILRVGPAGYGTLAAAPALGALLGALFTSVHPLPNRQGRVFLWAVAAYGAATIAFGFSRSFLLTFAALAGSGLADLVSTVIRQTLRQLITPDALRGRMTSINMIFFMGGPQLGELEAGVVASLFASAAVGATVSVVSGGLATLVVVAVIAGATRIVREYDLQEQPPHQARGG